MGGWPERPCCVSPSPPYASAECGTTGASASDLTASLSVWLAAKGVWNIANRGCNEVVVIVGEGGNGSLACVAADVVLVTAEGVFRNSLMCASNIEGARTQTVLARQDYLKTNQDAIIAQLSAVEVKLDQIIAGESTMEADLQALLESQLQQLMHVKGGSTTTELYTTRLDEVCDAAQAAIDAAAVFYSVHRLAQPLHDEGVALKATNPKKAYELCKKSFNHAANRSRSLK